MIKKAFLTNSSGILLSRVAGLVRDLCTAKILGAGVYSDIFFAAFKLPNLFRRVFGEGAFTQSFLPNFIRSRKKGMFALITLLIFAFVILLLSLFVVFCSGLVTKLLAWGFDEETIELAKPIVVINFWYLELVFIVTFLSSLLQYKNCFVTKLLAWGFDEETIELAKPIVVINFWYLELVFIVTFLSSLLQYKNCFWVNAYNTALLNIAMIAALLLAHDKQSMQVVYMLSYGVVCGGILQILLHFYPLYRLRFFKLLWVGVIELWQWCRTKNPDSKLKAKITQIKSELKTFFKQFFPAMLGSSTAQLATFTDTLLASFLAAGSISSLYYANRIFQFPLAIFAIAISTALFPLVAKAIKNNEQTKALQALKKSFWFLCIILCVCVVGGVMLSEEIISLLYEWGNFTKENTIIVAGVFSAYMIGLVPFGLSRIFSLWLYSHQMQGKAAKISAISLENTIIVAGVFSAYMIGLVPFGLSRIFSLWLYSHQMQGKAAKISAISLLCGIGFSLILMHPFGAMGLAFSGSLSGFVLFMLTIRIFGFKQFLAIIANTKAWLLLIAILSVEVLILWFLKPYVSDLVNAIHLFVRNIV